MAVSAGVTTLIFESLTQRLSAVASAKSQVFAAGIMPLVLAGLTLYISIIAISWIRGAIQQPGMEVLWRVVKMMLICAILTSSGLYGQQVVPALESLRDGLTGMAGGAPAYSVIDKMSSDIWDFSVKLFPTGNILSAGFWEGVFAYLAVLAARILFTIAAIVPMAMSLFYFYVGMIIGPIAIACALFPPTQKIFDSWLSTCLIALGTHVMVAILASMLTGFMEAALLQANEAFTGRSFAPVSIAIDFLVLTIIGVFVMWKAGDLSAQFLGGVSSYNPMDRVAMDGIKQSGSLVSQLVSAVRLKLGTGGSVKK